MHKHLESVEDIVHDWKYCQDMRQYFLLSKITTYYLKNIDLVWIVDLLFVKYV